MAKKKDDGIDKAYEKMIKNMLEQLEEQSPGIISEMNDRIEERKEGNGPLVLDASIGRIRAVYQGMRKACQGQE